MPSFEIYFSGLICHVGPSDKEGSDRTTLVKSILLADGDYHVPRILTSTTETDTQVDGGADIPFTIFGEKLRTGVTFSNMGAVARPRGLFQDSVPHLDDLTRSGVSLNSNPPGLTVQLPAGVFTVVQFYKYGAIWTLDGDISTRPCVPRVTMLKATGSDVIVNYNGQETPLSEDGGWALITNLEYKQPPNYVYGTDWKKQHTVTTGEDYEIAKYDPLATTGAPTCDKEPPYGKFTKHVLDIFPPRLVDTSECTNTHWP